MPNTPETMPVENRSAVKLSGVESGNEIERIAPSVTAICAAT